MKYIQDQLTQPLQAGRRGVVGEGFREKDWKQGQWRWRAEDQASERRSKEAEKHREDWLQNYILEEESAQAKPFLGEEKKKEKLGAAKLECLIKEVNLANMGPLGACMDTPEGWVQKPGEVGDVDPQGHGRVDTWEAKSLVYSTRWEACDSILSLVLDCCVCPIGGQSGRGGPDNVQYLWKCEEETGALTRYC